MKEVIFLSVEDVVVIHASAIEQEGGMAGVRDHGLLDAAVAMPRQQFGGVYLHEDVAAMAAAYLFHIAQNHPLYDGNKRAAVMSAFVFLDQNGIELTSDPTDLEAVTRQVAAGQMAKDALIRWMRKQIGGKRRPLKTGRRRPA
ncbi:type II toxin-antitoxin system death-on-curing family toxin [Nitrospira moscoviensis]|uniref:Putative death-on-curing family protein n=1 Tax=Nitrospira moscoviensis TaxID=42253 RepID=A0A0K2G8P7_NITMO|nr:type II toxin-antitoxin system death-on-curing family toxin [Nitrospira moscoviensis]ALA57333.1 putative death-on-curing family protein [Nitrospira moscoviensis]